MKNLNLILFVDDDSADNEFHEIVVKATGLAKEMKAITDSRKALDYFAQCFISNGDAEHPLPDLVFIDANMPAINGFEMLEKLRALPDPNKLRKKMKIVMLTGSLNPDDQSKALIEYGDLVSAYRIKPLTNSTFPALIQQLWG